MRNRIALPAPAVNRNFQPRSPGGGKEGGNGAERLEPSPFAAVHGGARGGRGVVMAGEVVEGVRQVEGEFAVGALPSPALLPRAFHVEDDFGAVAGVLAGKRGIGERDDVRHPRVADCRGVDRRDAGVVDEDEGDVAEWD